MKMNARKKNQKQFICLERKRFGKNRENRRLMNIRAIQRNHFLMRK